MASRGPRQAQILDLVRRRGFVVIEELARRFDVTTQTIRRDVNELCERALLRRYHGGAGLPSSVENLAYDTRQILCHREKRQIARLLATQVPNHASLFINIGTTTEEVARALLDHSGLRVITNNLNVAAILSGQADFEVIVTGGLVRSRDRGITGPAAVDTIRQFRTDFGIIGISGIDHGGALLDFDYAEVRVAQAILENAGTAFLAADHTKFGRSAMVRLGSVDQIGALFTDAAPPEPLATRLAAAGVAVFVADQDDDDDAAAA